MFSSLEALFDLTSSVLLKVNGHDGPSSVLESTTLSLYIYISLFFFELSESSPFIEFCSI